MKRFLIGKITKLHGLNGYLKLQSFSDSDFFSYDQFFDEQGKVIDLQYQSHQKGNVYLITIPGVNSATKAKDFIGKDIFGDRQELEEGEFYYADLVGLPIHDEDGLQLGVIESIKDFGAGPFVSIANSENKLVNAFFHKEAIVIIESDKVVILKEFVVS